MSRTSTELLEVASNAVDLSESDRHRLLESTRRRHALAILAEHDESLDLTEFATAVAARERSVDEDERAAVSRVANELHHIHLPMLSAAGVVDYDPETNRVTP